MVVASAAFVLPQCSVASLLPPPALVWLWAWGCSLWVGGEAGACCAGMVTFGCCMLPSLGAGGGQRGVLGRCCEDSIQAFETLFHIDAHNKASYSDLCSTCSVLQMLHMFKNVT